MGNGTGSRNINQVRCVDVPKDVPCTSLSAMLGEILYTAGIGTHEDWEGEMSSDGNTDTSDEGDTEVELDVENSSRRGGETVARQSGEEAQEDEPAESEPEDYSSAMEVDDTPLPELIDPEVLAKHDIPYDLTVTIPRGEITSVNETSASEEDPGKSAGDDHEDTPAQKKANVSRVLL